MTKAEIDRQFDAIVDLAGVEQFIDTGQAISSGTRAAAREVFASGHRAEGVLK